MTRFIPKNNTASPIRPGESAITSRRHKLLVSLCTFNERENLAALIAEIHTYAPDCDVVVIDDNSPDGTGQLADELAREDTRISVLHRTRKLGLGTATLAGMRYAIEHEYEFLINLDADFSHHPRYLPAIRECMARVDVAVGSRYVPGGGIENWGLLRHFMSRGVNWYARLLLGLKTKDNSGSYRCYRVAKLAELDFSRVVARGYAFQEEILYRCARVACRFEEVPIVFEDRRSGESKINWKESVAALWILFRLGLERLAGISVRTSEHLGNNKTTSRSSEPRA